MAQYSRLSIWENPHGMSWYDYVVGRKSPAEPFITPNTKLRTDSDDQTNWVKDYSCTELAYQDAWFNELKAQDRRKKDARMKPKTATSRTTDVAMSGLNTKSLQPDPYFEYMFADAELDNNSERSGNSIDDLSFGKQSTGNESTKSADGPLDCSSSAPEWQPGTTKKSSAEPQFLDASAFSQQEGDQLRSTIFDKGFGINHDSVAESNLRYQNIEKNKIHTSELPYGDIGLSGGIRTPGLSGVFYDLRLKHEHTVGSVEDESKYQAKNGVEKEAQLLPTINKLDGVRGQQKRLLKPISQKVIKERQSKASGNYKNPAQRRAQKVQAPNLLSQVSKKRPAEDFCDNELCQHTTGNPHLKKVRLCEDETDQREEEMVRVPSTAAGSIFSDAASSRQASGDFFNHKALAIAPRGYAGQFEGMVIKPNLTADYKINLTNLDQIKSDVHHTFGDRRHPNGIFTHTAITFDPLCKVPDFTKENLPSGHALFTCMDFATNMTITAAGTDTVKLRSRDEEILRREGHIECARARLEGVTVGYYRYYQGHLSIEEYHDAEMCIC